MAFDVKPINVKGRLKDTIAARSINLMCEVTKGLTYSAIYDSSFHYNPANNPGPGNPPIPADPSDRSPLDQMIHNVINITDSTLKRGASNNTEIVIDQLTSATGALTLMKADLIAQGYPDLKLGTLFHKMAAQTSGAERKGFEAIIKRLEDLHGYDPANALKDQMFHFCAPFLTIQGGRVPKLGETPIEKSMPDEPGFRNNFLKWIGPLTMQDLYDKFDVKHPNYTEIRNAAKYALAHCILKEYRPADTRPAEPISTEGAGGNSRYCQGNGNGCADCTHPDDWCNDYVQNATVYCTLGSDYH